MSDWFETKQERLEREYTERLEAQIKHLNQRCEDAREVISALLSWAASNKRLVNPNHSDRVIADEWLRGKP